MESKPDTMGKVLAYLGVLLGTMGKVQELAAILQPAADAKRELTAEEDAQLDAFVDREMARLSAANQA